MGQPGNASFQALMGTGYMTFLGQFQLFKKKKKEKKTPRLQGNTENI